MKKTVKSIFQQSPMLLLLALANTVEAVPRIAMTFLGDWDQAYRYKKGDVVSYNNTLYQSLAGKNQATPGIGDTHWRKILGGNSGGTGSSDNTPDCAHPGAGANLVGCDFQNPETLRNKDLRGSQLVNARLSGDVGLINLQGANLTGATLGVSDDGDPPTGSSLTLQGSIYGSGGPRAILHGTNLSGTITPNGFPIQASTYVDFRYANLTAIDWNRANLEATDMQYATLTNASILNCNCLGVNMFNADLRSARLGDAKLEGAIFSEADLTRAQLWGANLTNADLTNANMTYANLSNGDASTNLAGANFSGADLTGTDFTGATGGDTAIYTSSTHFDATICPDGVKVNGTSVTNCQGHGFGAPQ